LFVKSFNIKEAEGKGFQMSYSLVRESQSLQNGDQKILEAPIWKISRPYKSELEISALFQYSDP
jgi:hypothetical protein